MSLLSGSFICFILFFSLISKGLASDGRDLSFAPDNFYQDLVRVSPIDIKDVKAN